MSKLSFLDLPGIVSAQGSVRLPGSKSLSNRILLLVALAGGAYHLSGVPRMHERPIGDLVDALRHLGADIAYLANDGYPPLQIRPGTLGIADNGAQTIHVKGNVSSQFLTGLLMAVPLLNRTVT